LARRPAVLGAAGALAAILVPQAAAVKVHVRVEGKTRTIFGAAAPVLDVTSPRANPLPENALDALATASFLGEFYFHVTDTHVDQVGRYPAQGQTGWAVKVNGKSASSRTTLRAGDSVLWYWAQFGIVGGPKALVLSGGANCYRVVAQDDKGRITPAVGAVLRVDGRTVRTQGAMQAVVGCVGKHRGLVRATLGGAVRSNALS
jgi:hypothetical protein